MAAPLRAELRDGRTRVLRSPPGEPCWELWQRAPSPPLARIVAGLWAGGSADSFARHRALPNGELMLMFHVSAPQRVVEAGGRPCSDQRELGFLAGVHDRPFTVESIRRDTYVVTARLRPAGVAALFRSADPAELAGRVVDLEGAVGRRSEAERLCHQLHEATDLGAALDRLEQWLLARADPRRLPREATRAASELIEGSAGTLRVEAISRAVGVSPRRLNELFQRDVGLPVKRLARVVRFRRTLDHLHGSPSPDLALLALRAGYYDESHLYRDFRELALLTPTEYLAALGDGFDGPDVIAS